METLEDLLAASRRGTDGAVERLFSLAYQELHALAHQRLRRSAAVTNLDTTVLVHECYLRLAETAGFAAEDRAMFLAYAARAMRSIVVDLLRQRAAERHGGDAIKITLAPESEELRGTAGDEVLRLNDALEDLARLDPRLVQVVEMKYFAGMTFDEIASALGVVERTARRDWQKARLLLHAALRT